MRVTKGKLVPGICKWMVNPRSCNILELIPMQMDNLTGIRLYFGGRSAKTRRTEINQPANAAFQVVASA